MAIEIGTQKEIVEGMFVIRVLKIKALTREQLPRDYLIKENFVPGDENTIVYLAKGNGTNYLKSNVSYNQAIGDRSNILLKEGKSYHEKTFNRILSIIHDAGKNLYRINNPRREREWQGKKTFII